MASFLQFTLPGAPTVYYGDEVGMEGYADPFNRRTYPWGREDEELLAHYRRLGQLRRDNPALRVQPFPSSLRLTAGWALSGAGTVRWRNGWVFMSTGPAIPGAFPAGRLLLGHNLETVAPDTLILLPGGFCALEVS